LEDSAAIKTYRYLRISMVGVVVLLAASIVIERSNAGCWQTSVSAYYYTPVRAILVGGLMAIGLSLIVIKGTTTFEDASLNVAGMMAPVVAVVPTTDVGACWSVTPAVEPVDQTGELEQWVIANIDNNIVALLIAGIGGLVVAAVIASIATGNVRAVAEVGEPGTRLGLLGALLLLFAGALVYIAWDDFDTRAHGIAAVAMFFFPALAVGGNAYQNRHHADTVGYFRWYAALAVSMIAVPIVMFPFGSSWDHMVLVPEATEIVLFALFWLVQTHEHWNETAGEPAAKG
jgi:hypothetical protein